MLKNIVLLQVFGNSSNFAAVQVYIIAKGLKSQAR